MPWFHCSVYLSRTNDDVLETGTTSWLRRADTAKEAERKVKEMILRKYPPSDGWGNYSVSANEITKDMFARLAEEYGYVKAED
jgi:hypothetical protein